MILLKLEVFKHLNHTVEGLRAALQIAIELEHSTIPPYLYAMYSLKPGKNSEIAGIIRSVALEEMLHMSLACNVLNAVGGSPLIDDPKFIPSYPCHLPGAVENHLIVPLGAFSMQLLAQVFMAIEEPEHPLDIPVVSPEKLSLREGGAGADEVRTIGMFYRAIQKQIVELSEHQDIFTGDPARQLTTVFDSIPLTAVTDVRSAVAAIELIVDQGEGTATTPFDEEHDPSHYYRYQEILKGYRLVPNPYHAPDQPPYIFGGAEITFDPQEVWPALTNPTSASYPAGSPAAVANRDFNRTYSRMLRSLHEVFNGQPDRIATAILNMQALRQQATYLMSLSLGGRVTAGPTFEYVTES